MQTVGHGHQIIQPEDLKVLQELGEGQYGIVEQGEWKPPHGKDTVITVEVSLLHHSDIIQWS